MLREATEYVMYIILYIDAHASILFIENLRRTELLPAFHQQSEKE